MSNGRRISLLMLMPVSSWSLYIFSFHDASANDRSVTFFFNLELIMRQTGVIEDARYKRKEALVDLASALTKGSR